MLTRRFSFMCPEMSPKRTLIGGTLLTNVSWYRPWFPGLNFLKDGCNTCLSSLTRDVCQSNDLSKGISQRNVDLPLYLHYRYSACYSMYFFSPIFHIFSPAQDTMTICKVIFSAGCLHKGPFHSSPGFSSPYSLFIQIPLLSAAALSFRE